MRSWELGVNLSRRELMEGVDIFQNILKTTLIVSNRHCPLFTVFLKTPKQSMGAYKRETGGTFKLLENEL